jgi:serine/threonine protein phosphatase 1
MTRTYAIPDLHGRLDLLSSALDMVVAHATGHRGKIITLGDYVDRGPDSRGVIERLSGWRSDTLQLVALKGNHEAMMWEVCANLAELSRWIQNGGDATLASYGVVEHPPRLEDIPRSHLDWIAGLPLLHADRHRVFVHAGVDPTIPLRQQSEQVALWMRYPKDHTKGYGSRHVVHGHHAHPDGPIVTRGRSNLDGMAWKTGRLVIGVFDDDRPGGPIEVLTVTGAPA